LVAARVGRLRTALEAQPHEAAAAVGPAAAIRVLRRLVKPPAPRLTVRDVVRGVATLGGFLGREGDGEPGGARWGAASNGFRTWGSLGSC
jgi:hypothetical protein